MADRIRALRERLTGHRKEAERSEPQVDQALITRRDRLVERFTAHQLDLGGVLYEMAIRDHVTMPVLLERAAVMQGVEADLKDAQAAVERAEAGIAGRAEGTGAGAAGRASCPACGAHAARDAAFCSACGAGL